MPGERLPMRKLRDVLRLHAAGLSKRRIAVSLDVGATSVGSYLRRARRASLSWPLPDGLSDEELERLLFPPPVSVSPDRRPLPDWPALHGELRKPAVTLSLLWEEYREVYPEGYGYSRFCDLHRAWKGRLVPTMRQVHVAGEKMFVDYAGATVEVIDPETGEVGKAQLFVATLGASSYTYAEATWTQGLPDWIGSHTRAFAFFGGVPGQVVPDNLKSGVSRACLYDPEINRTYADMAAHYGTAILPARPRKPRDKAKVEVAVQVVERWVLARLRKRRFFSLAEVNQAIHELLEELNGRQTKHLGASRRQLFEALDQPALKSLPAQAYEYAEWKQRRAGLDYHVEVAKHYYSVPHGLAKQKLWARITDRTVEIFHKGKRVAAHMRGSGNRRHTTVAEHMPSAHRRYASWTLERIRRYAATTGSNTEALIDLILRSKPHPEQGFRSAIGILRLARTHGSERLEAACERAFEIGAHSYSSVASILRNNLDRREPPQSSDRATDGPTIQHRNIRGSGYFH
ncbi:MAG: IS21 family transposase [Proteobacteria bacterium]|nr:IS21 family transposase [Pseudomonadota bacterium]